MALCKAKTKTGKRCGNLARSGSNYCAVHKRNESKSAGLSIGIGALVGHAIAPGIGGLVVGGTTGLFASAMGRNGMRKKTRVFVSFDFDNDKKLKDFIIGQSRLADSPFSIEDHSLKEAAPERNWKDKARAAIRRSDIVLVMVGPKTHKAHGVLAEVGMARDEGKPIVQVIGYRNGDYTAVPNAGRLYRWDWANLKKILG